MPSFTSIYKPSEFIYLYSEISSYDILKHN